MNVCDQENIEKLKLNANLLRLWNNVLNKSDNDLSSKSSLKSMSRSNFKLDNYVFRLESVMNGHGQSSNNEKLEEIIEKCNIFLRKNSHMNEYIGLDKENDCRANNNSIEKDVECIEISEDISIENQNKTNIEQNKPAKLKKDDPKNENRLNEMDKVELSSSQFEALIQSLDSFKINLKEENIEKLEQIIINISNKYNQNFLKQFCANLLDIGQFTGELKSLEQIALLSLQENELCLIINIIINLNTTENFLSFNSSSIFLRYVLTNYIICNLSQSENNLNAIFSRKLFTVCSNLCKKLTNQFINSCLIIWMTHINEINIDSSSKSSSTKILVEFLIKIIKESFGEREALVTIETLLNEQSDKNKWTENFYMVASCLIEKLENLNFEILNLLVEKLNIDSDDLDKSLIFSKFILLVLNKHKSILVNSNSNNYSIQIIKSFNSIINKNKTVMKKTLQSLANCLNKNLN